MRGEKGGAKKTKKVKRKIEEWEERTIANVILDSFPQCQVEFAPNGKVVAVTKAKDLALRFASDDFESERLVWHCMSHIFFIS